MIPNPLGWCHGGFMEVYIVVRVYGYWENAGLFCGLCIVGAILGFKSVTKFVRITTAGAVVAVGIVLDSVQVGLWSTFQLLL